MNAAAAFIKETQHRVSSHLLFCLIRIAQDFFSYDPFRCLIQILIPCDSNCTTTHFRRMAFWAPDPMAQFRGRGGPLSTKPKSRGAGPKSLLDYSRPNPYPISAGALH